MEEKVRYLLYCIVTRQKGMERKYHILLGNGNNPYRVLFIIIVNHVFIKVLRISDFSYMKA